jgi:hypothetical protein
VDGSRRKPCGLTGNVISLGRFPIRGAGIQPLEGKNGMEISSTSKMLAGVILVTIPTIRVRRRIHSGNVTQQRNRVLIPLCSTTCFARATHTPG